MNVYLDSSVVLRRLFGQRGMVAGWGTWNNAYASVLVRLEVLRTIDRMRLSHRILDREVGRLVTSAHAVFEALQFIPLNGAILERAAQSFPTTLGTLDALHLSSALWVTREAEVDVTVLTHDRELALAAQSMNLPVEGV